MRALYYGPRPVQRLYYGTRLAWQLDDGDPDPLPVPVLSYTFDGHPYPVHGQAILNSHTHDWVPGRRGQLDLALSLDPPIG